MKLSLVIPAYEAEPFLGERLRLLSDFLVREEPDHELIVVDDGSTDGTAECAEALELPRCRVLRLPANRGKTHAIAHGVEVSRGRCVLFTDADAPYDCHAIPYMTALVLERGFHVVLGDRTLADSSYRETAGPLRTWVGRAFRFYVRILVTGGIHDTQCGLKAFQGDVARALFPLLREPGFCGDVELVYVALRYNLAIRHVPVRLVHQGPSSVRVVRHGLSMLLTSLRLRGRYRAGLYDCEDLRELASQRYWEADPFEIRAAGGGASAGSRSLRPPARSATGLGSAALPRTRRP